MNSDLGEDEVPSKRQGANLACGNKLFLNCNAHKNFTSTGIV